MSELKDFQAEVEQFLLEQDMPPTVFGIKALSDPGFVFELRKGRDVRFSTVGKVRAFIKKQRQKKAARQHDATAA
jgi:predicted transcriptional regulator